MGSMRVRALLLLLAALLLPAAAGGAETARQILDRQKALDDGERHWSDRHQRLQMDVIDPHRAPRHMTMDVFDKKYPGSEQRTMAYFSAPEAVKGTAFLAVTHSDRQADQWLYLPEAKRARRIGGESRKSGFVGTDFTYHDLDLLSEMVSWTEADAASSLRGDETIDGVACHVIELRPKRDDIGYQLIVLWLGNADLVARQVEFYEEAPSSGWFGFGGDGTQPVRRLKQSDLRPIGNIPVPHAAEVQTPRTGTKTVVTFDHVVFDQALPDELFTQPAMEWGRYTPNTERN